MTFIRNGWHSLRWWSFLNFRDGKTSSGVTARLYNNNNNNKLLIITTITINLHTAKLLFVLCIISHTSRKVLFNPCLSCVAGCSHKHTHTNLVSKVHMLTRRGPECSHLPAFSYVPQGKSVGECLQETMLRVHTHTHTHTFNPFTATNHRWKVSPSYVDQTK